MGCGYNYKGWQGVAMKGCHFAAGAVTLKLLIPQVA